jgi:transcriptional regulator with XRE-family HTH domain
MNIIGKRVQKARQNFSPPMSQKELASRLHAKGWKISRGSLAKIEVEIRRVTDQELVLLAKALEVSPDWLLKWK